LATQVTDRPKKLRLLDEREGHDFHDLRQRLILRLILGGAAVRLCDKWHISNVGFSRFGNTAARKILFPQPPSPKHQTYSLSDSSQ
jgi:hypothetical protein